MHQQRARVSGPGSSSRSGGPELAPGKRTLTEHLPAAGGTAGVQRAAAHGVSGPAQRLPYANTIQTLFGRHDVSGVQAHVGGAAAEGAAQMGAQAYATGNSIAFGESPNLHTAAHEAAHVVQQRSGVQLKGGVGQVGDAYEQHADAVADLVVQGRSAESLLDRYSGSGSSPASTGAVQRIVTGYKDATTLYNAVKTQIGLPPDHDEDAEWKVGNGMIKNPFDPFEFNDVVQAVLKSRKDRHEKRKAAKRKVSEDELSAMYGKEIKQTGTEIALGAVMKSEDNDCGVFLSTSLSECESSEQSGMFVPTHHTIALPDLERLEMFDTQHDNGLTPEANCRLIAEHELVHLLHSWNNYGNRDNPHADTAVNDFLPKRLEVTVEDLHELVPQDDSNISKYLSKRLAYIQSSFEKSGRKKNNEAPAVLRELRRYLEALYAQGALTDSYTGVFDQIVRYDNECTKSVNRGRYDIEGDIDDSTVKRTVGNSTVKVDNSTEAKPLIEKDPDPSCCTLF